MKLLTPDEYVWRVEEPIAKARECLRLRDQLGMRGSAGMIGEGSMLLRQRIESWDTSCTRGEFVSGHILDTGNVLHAVDEVMLSGDEVEDTDELHDTACAGRALGERVDNWHAVGVEDHTPPRPL